MRYEIFLGRNCLYYFRFVAANGQIIAVSGDGYTTRANCMYALNLIKHYSISAPIINK